MSALRNIAAASLFSALLPIAPTAAATMSRVCEHSEVIVALADSVLANRGDLGRFAAARYGAIAAYLKLHYDDLAPDAVGPMLDGLVEAKVRTASIVKFAFEVSTLGPDQALDGLTDDPDALRYIVLTPSGIRALILAGEADRVVQLITAMPEDDHIYLFRSFATAVIDQPEERKRELQALADEKGQPVLVAALAAVRTEPGVFEEALNELPDDLATYVVGFFLLLPAVVGGELPQVEMPGWYERARHVIAVSALSPKVDFLMTIVNQTGLVAEIDGVAATVLAAYDEGRLDPTGTLDAGWLLQFRLLNLAIGAPKVRSTIDSFDAAIGRPWSGRLGALTDWMLAIEALSPYLRSEVETLPEPPDYVSAEFAAEWANWIEIAEAVKSGGDLAAYGADDVKGVIAAELLYAKGDYAALADYVTNAASPVVSARAAEDFAERLDRQCDDLTWFPGEAVLLIGETMFRFDPES